MIYISPKVSIKKVKYEKFGGKPTPPTVFYTSWQILVTHTHTLNLDLKPYTSWQILVTHTHTLNLDLKPYTSWQILVTHTHTLNLDLKPYTSWQILV